MNAGNSTPFLRTVRLRRFLRGVRMDEDAGGVLRGTASLPAPERARDPRHGDGPPPPTGRRPREAHDRRSVPAVPARH